MTIASKHEKAADLQDVHVQPGVDFINKKKIHWIALTLIIVVSAQYGRQGYFSLRIFAFIFAVPDILKPSFYFQLLVKWWCLHLCKDDCFYFKNP